MRGSPLLRALLVFVALLALGPVLWKLTRADAVAPPVEQPIAQPAAAARVGIVLTFSTAAKKVALLHLGKEIWSKTQPGIEEETSVELPWPKEGVELRAIVEWPAGIPAAAMRVKLIDPAGNEHDRTVWGRGLLDDVLAFP